MATPKDLIQIDSGITESLWAVDNRSNVYVFIDGNWDLVQGRMASVSAGASVIATSEDGFTWHREGVSFANPKGDRWKQTNVAVPMFRVECGMLINQFIILFIIYHACNAIYHLSYLSFYPLHCLKSVFTILKEI